MLSTAISTDHILSKHPAPFSEQFFASLDFEEAATLTLPKILPPNALDLWTWVNEPSQPLKLISTTDYIPHLNDLADITHSMADASHEGMHGIILTLYTPLGKKTVSGYLSLVCPSTILAIQILSIFLDSALCFCQQPYPPCEYGQSGTLRLTEAKLLSVEHIDALKRERILSTSLSTAAAMPLWELGMLTGEHWLRDDILNSYGEFTYFRHLATNPLRDLQHLPLTTHFYEEAELLYDQTPHLYSPNLIGIRSRLYSSNFRGFSLELCIQNHWSTYYYNRSSVLKHRDSLNNPSIHKVMDVVNWVVEGLNVPWIEKLRRWMDRSNQLEVGAVVWRPRIFQYATWIPLCLPGHQNALNRNVTIGFEN